MSGTIGSLHNVHVQTKINVSLFFDEQQINSTSFPTITNNTFLYTSTIMNIHTRYIYSPCYIYVVTNNSIKIKIIIHHHHHHPHHPYYHYHLSLQVSYRSREIENIFFISSFFFLRLK